MEKVSNTSVYNKVILCLLIILLLSLRLNAQSLSSRSFNFCSSSNCLNLKSGKIFLIGEYHHKYNNHLVILNYLKCISELNKNVKVLFLEIGPGTAYVLNKYLKTGDKYLLELVFKDNMTDLLVTELYTILQKNDKFSNLSIVGVDYEDYTTPTYFSLRDIIITSLIENDKNLYENICNSNTFNNEFSSILRFLWLNSDCISIKEKDLHQDILQIHNSIKDDSLKWKSILQNKLDVTLDLVNSYIIPKQTKDIYSMKSSPKRDLYMANKIYNTFKNDTTSVCLGQLGATHVKKNQTKYGLNTASILNFDTSFFMTNKKVHTSIIVYKTFPKRISLKFEPNRKVLNEGFYLSKGCMLLKEPSDLKSAELLIYLDNTR